MRRHHVATAKPTIWEVIQKQHSHTQRHTHWAFMTNSTTKPEQTWSIFSLSHSWPVIFISNTHLGHVFMFWRVYMCVCAHTCVCICLSVCLCDVQLCFIQQRRVFRLALIISPCLVKLNLFSCYWSIVYIVSKALHQWKAATSFISCGLDIQCCG